MNLGKGDSPRLGLRPKKEEIRMTIGIRIEQVRGQTATESFQFARRSARQEMGMS
jgi:hypothetical protein